MFPLSKLFSPFCIHYFIYISSFQGKHELGTCQLDGHSLIIFLLLLCPHWNVAEQTSISSSLLISILVCLLFGSSWALPHHVSSLFFHNSFLTWLHYINYFFSYFQQSNQSDSLQDYFYIFLFQLTYFILIFSLSLSIMCFSYILQYLYQEKYYKIKRSIYWSHHVI